MTELNVDGKTVVLDEEGFLQNPAEWDRKVAEVLASQAGIELTDEHWKVIDFCRKDFEATGQPPGLRRITKVGGIPTKTIYTLFPGGPGKLAAKIAGLHKPTGCV